MTAGNGKEPRTQAAVVQGVEDLYQDGEGRLGHVGGVGHESP